MFSASPVSVSVVAVGVAIGTAEPAEAELGGTAPVARRTMISARSSSLGLAHDNDNAFADRFVTTKPVTGPGAVTSVETVRVVGWLDVLPAVSSVNTA